MGWNGYIKLNKKMEQADWLEILNSVDDFTKGAYSIQSWGISMRIDVMLTDEKNTVEVHGSYGGSPSAVRRHCTKEIRKALKKAGYEINRTVWSF